MARKKNMTLDEAAQKLTRIAVARLDKLSAEQREACIAAFEKRVCS